MNRPAETAAAVAAAVAVLIAWLAHIDDAAVVAAMTVVVGAVPAGITWLVELFGRKQSTHSKREQAK